MCLRQTWGNITHNAVLKCGTRELDLVKTYTGHERDSVLGQYYAKARMYDTADKHGSSKGNKLGDKRFTAVDPVKGNVRNPQSLVQYTYVLNNPLMYVDPLGLWTGQIDVSAALSLGGSVEKSYTLNIDGEGNIALIENFSYGGGTPDVGGSVTLGSTNAPNYMVLINGQTLTVGGSLAIATGDVITIIDQSSGETYSGFAGGVGVSYSPVEIHGRITDSTLIFAINPLKWPEKINKYMHTLAEDNYKQLSDEEKKIIENLIQSSMEAVQKSVS